MNNEEKILALLEKQGQQLERIELQLDKHDQRLGNLEQGLLAIQAQQARDTETLDIIVTQVFKLAEVQNIHEQRFEKLKAI